MTTGDPPSDGLPPTAHDPEALARLLADLGDHLVEVAGALAPRPGVYAKPPGDPGPQPPVRSLVLDSLGLLLAPATTRVLRDLVAARHARDIKPTQFGSLARDEREAFSRAPEGSRRTWVCSCVAFDTLRAVPRYRAHSAWPLAERVIAPTTPRRLDLLVAARLCTLATRAADVAVDPEALVALALGSAKIVPGVKPGQRIELAALARDAERHAAAFDPEERRLREQAAARLAEESPEVQLFGR